MLLVKFIVLLLLGFVIVSLFTGLFYLVRDKGQTNRTVNALTLRIGLSVVAIIIIMIAGATGVIEMNPNPITGGSATAATSDIKPEEPEVPEKSIFNTGGRTRVDDGS